MQINNSKNLFVVTTPIGNLKDITLRAIETLQLVDVILVEDSRVTGKLLHHYEIQKKMISYHSHKEEKINFEKLFATYSNIALISDAGTPCISDPGYSIIHYCHENNINVTPIPGVSAVTTAISTCGIPFKDFYFFGFLPNKSIKRKTVLQNLLEKEKKIIIFYESPYRLLNLLEMLKIYDENILVSVCKELTKKFENILTTTALAVFEFYSQKNIKGEFVVIVKNY